MTLPSEASTRALGVNLALRLVDLKLLILDIDEYERLHNLRSWDLCSPHPECTPLERQRMDALIDDWNMCTFQTIKIVEELALRSAESQVGSASLRKLLKVFAQGLRFAPGLFDRCVVETSNRMKRKWADSQPFLVWLQFVTPLLPLAGIPGLAYGNMLIGWMMALWNVFVHSGPPGLVGSGLTIYFNARGYTEARRFLELLGLNSKEQTKGFSDAGWDLNLQVMDLFLIYGDTEKFATKLNLRDQWMLCEFTTRSAADRLKKQDLIAAWDDRAARVVRTVSQIASHNPTSSWMWQFARFCEQHPELFRRCFIEDLLSTSRKVKAASKVLQLVGSTVSALSSTSSETKSLLERGLLGLWGILTGSSAAGQALRAADSIATTVYGRSSASSRWLLRQLGLDAVAVPQMTLQDFPETLKLLNGT